MTQTHIEAEKASLSGGAGIYTDAAASGGAGIGYMTSAGAATTFTNLPASSQVTIHYECGHGTAFKTAWLNDAVYQIASFLVLRPATPWRWSHTRHHTDTIIVGRDPEIRAPRPPI